MDIDHSLALVFGFVSSGTAGYQTKLLGPGRSGLRLKPCKAHGSQSPTKLTCMQVFAFGQWAVVMCALNDGLGKTIGTVKPDSAATAAAVRVWCLCRV